MTAAKTGAAEFIVQIVGGGAGKLGDDLAFETVWQIGAGLRQGAEKELQLAAQGFRPGRDNRAAGRFWLGFENFEALRGDDGHGAAEIVVEGAAAPVEQGHQQNQPACQDDRAVEHRGQ